MVEVFTGVGYCHSPETQGDWPNCDIHECAIDPEYEVFPFQFGTRRPIGNWFFLCRSHLELVQGGRGIEPLQEEI